MASVETTATSTPELVATRPSLGRLRAGVLIPIVAIAAVAALWPSAASLYEVWRDIHDYQHGFLLAPAAIVWFALALRRCGSLPVRPDLRGAVVLAVALAAWIVMRTANSVAAHQLLFPLCVWFAIWAAAGWPLARRLIAPVAFLYFATPVWEYALPLLQRLSVSVTETTLGWLGISAQVHEYTVTIPGGSFQIIEGCSGKRYFMVTLAVAVLAAALNHLRGLRAIGFVLACGALALLANWLRIVIVIHAGYTYGMQTYLVAVEHLTLGNVIFVLLLAVVLLLARRLAGPIGPASPPVEVGAAPPPRRWAAVLPVALLAAVFVTDLARSAAPADRAMPGVLPLATGRWQGPLPADVGWMPQFPGTAGARRASYSSEAGVVQLYIGTYGAQRQGQELIQYGNTLLAPGTWNRAWPHEAHALSPHTPRLASFEARAADGDLWLLAYLYDVGGWSTSQEAFAQLAYGLRSIRRPTPSGIVALAVRCDSSCKSARALAGAFWDDMSRPILAMLPSAGGNR